MRIFNELSFVCVLVKVVSRIIQQSLALVRGFVLTRIAKLVFRLIFDFVFLDVFVVVSFNAGAANDDKEEADHDETTHHDPSPDASFARDDEHGCDEEVEDALSYDALQELEVLHDELEIAKG